MKVSVTETGRHTGQRLKEMLADAPDFASGPVVVFWETTKACALKCLHCRATAIPQRNPLELTTEEGFRLLDDLASGERKPIVIITGGDPFMRRDLFELLEYGKSIGLIMSVSPSVTSLITRERLKRLFDLGISRLSFSLDGSNAEIHDTFRGVAGSFDMTMDRMQDALDVGLSLQINTVVSRHTLKDLPRIAELLATYPKVVLWDVFFLVPTGRGQRDDVISPEEHEEVYRFLMELEDTAPFLIKTTLGQHYRRARLLNSLEDVNDLEKIWAKVSRASANDGKAVCFVSHIGEVYPSGFLPIRCGNARQESVMEIYRSNPIFQELRNPDKLNGKSGRCPFRAVCGGCRARAYAMTGDHMGAEPSCSFNPDTFEFE
jgi:radical SAM protein